MILGILAWGVNSLLILLGAYLGTRWLRTPSRYQNALIFLLLTIYLTTLLTFTAGLAGLLAPVPLLLISAVLLLALLLTPRTRKELLALPAELRGLRDGLCAWWLGLPRWLRWFTALALTVSALRFVLLVLLLPPFVWDSLTYHLTNVAHWVQQGRIELFATSMTRIYTPANYEVYAAWFTVFIHHDLLIEAAGIPAYLLAVLAVYSLARTLEATPAAAWMGALTYAALPGLLIAATGTKNDPHMAAYFLALLALLLPLAKPKGKIGPGGVTGQVALAASVYLLAFGTKAYLLHITPGILLILIIGVRAGEGWRTWVTRLGDIMSEWRGSARAQRALLLGLLISALALGFYWNVRNWALTGNPFFPYGVKLEGEQVLTGAERDAVLGFSRLKLNLESFAWKFGDRQARVGPDLTDTTGWGWFGYSLGIAALIWGVLKRRDLRVLGFGFLLSFLAIFLSIRPSPWNMRYLLWFPAVFSLAFAVLLDQAHGKEAWLERGLLTLAAAGMAMNFISVWNYGRLAPEDFERLSGIPILERGSAQLGINMPFEYENSLEIVPRDAVLGYNVGTNGFIYPLYRPDYSQHLAYIPVNPGDSCEDIAARMRAHGTRYLFLASVHTSDEVLGILHVCGERRGVIRERAVNLYVIN